MVQLFQNSVHYYWHDTNDDYYYRSVWHYEQNVVSTNVVVPTSTSNVDVQLLPKNVTPVLQVLQNLARLFHRSLMMLHQNFHVLQQNQIGYYIRSKPWNKNNLFISKYVELKKEICKNKKNMLTNQDALANCYLSDIQ